MGSRINVNEKSKRKCYSVKGDGVGKMELSKRGEIEERKVSVTVIPIGIQPFAVDVKCLVLIIGFCYLFFCYLISSLGTKLITK